MIFYRSLWLLALAPLTQYVSAQQSTPVSYTDPDTGIVFDTWTASGSRMTFGFTFPEDGQTTNADEFIGYIKCTTPSGKGTGWCGLSYGGPMTNSLLLMAYPHDGDILTSFLWANAQVEPVPYKGKATLTQISSSITADGFTLIYRCQGCTSWSQDGNSGQLATTSSIAVLGWAHSTTDVIDPECPREARMLQHETQSIFGGQLTSNAFNGDYDQWAKLATKVVDGNCDGGSTPTSTATAEPSSTAAPTGTPVPDETYDYVVVGGGAGGLPIADRLSEAGKKVLLIEKGPPSSGRWGGTRKPDWLGGTNLTRFDVPGLCNEIWADSSGIACPDTDQMAGCVLGGGTAINAGLWWRPNPQDWDFNFPDGWKAKDMATYEQRVFGRIPGTRYPSMDGKLYLDQGFKVVAGALNKAGWNEVNALEKPGAKNRTYTHPPFMFSNGERGGPLATYLVSAKARNNFKYWTNTQVRRVVRSGGHVTGLEVEPFSGAGYVGTVKLTPETGRVVLAAGTFGSAKILLRSGIGPDDQLSVVANSSRDGGSMIAKEQWINLPVGYNLEDHTNTDTVIKHPSVVFYDFYEAYDNPIPSDKNKYLDARSGILAQAAPNIGPIIFDEISGADGRVRSMQWTARVEPSLGETSNKSITISQYLGRGAKSRGRMTITSALNTVVSGNPYLNDAEDKKAVVKALDNLRKALSGVEGLEWLQPAPGVTSQKYVDDMVVSWSNRRANHWIGTNKLGKDDGRSGGTAVVDLNTKVYGTDNLFVTDASIFPGMVTTNPSSYIVTVAERASAAILALPVSKAQGQYQQCGGNEWTGSMQCGKGFYCKVLNPFYSQCYPDSE
ncbi:cellobiose dehydrogenase [Fusarium pseudoanthophilum]|uniref:Cellobiose dehydrogenase n=1 Tax=Fusarium pseudoanthophilum TaxID=48495 RepID=A0A8H5NNY4_9HYPO|nr:cellobiose dehydrogenase [Fusarium pseudoanthophilum]